MHDGYHNTYLVHKGDVRYKLRPLPLDQLHENFMIFFEKHLQVNMQGKTGEDTGWMRNDKLQQGYEAYNPKN